MDRNQRRQGDERTPDKIIGEIKYARGQSSQAEQRPGDEARKERAEKSQREGPAAYAPTKDEPTASDEE